MADSEHLEPERPETVKLKVCRYCLVRQGQYPPNGVHVCACEEDGPVWVEIDFVPASSLTSLEAERDEAQRSRELNYEKACEWRDELIAAETRAAQWEGSFNGMVEVEKRLLTRLEAVREWAGSYAASWRTNPDLREAAQTVLRLLDPADGEEK